MTSEENQVHEIETLHDKETAGALAIQLLSASLQLVRALMAHQEIKDFLVASQLVKEEDWTALEERLLSLNRGVAHRCDEEQLLRFAIKGFSLRQAKLMRSVHVEQSTALKGLSLFLPVVQDAPTRFGLEAVPAHVHPPHHDEIPESEMKFSPPA